MNEYFIVMTLQGVQGGGLRTINLVATKTFDSPMTRAQVWDLMVEDIPADCRDLAVVFFSVEPNALPVQRPVGTESLMPRRGGDAR
jgi:hypothetical protein